GPPRCINLPSASSPTLRRRQANGRVTSSPAAPIVTAGAGRGKGPAGAHGTGVWYGRVSSAGPPFGQQSPDVPPVLDPLGFRDRAVQADHFLGGGQPAQVGEEHGGQPVVGLARVAAVVAADPLGVNHEFGSEPGALVGNPARRLS